MSAQGGGSYSLGEAVQAALRKNFEIEVASFEPGIAEAELLEARGVFDPELVFEYARSEDGSRRQLDPRIGIDDPDSLFLEDRYRAGISGRLPWGMEYEFGMRAENRRGTFNFFTDEYDSFAGLTLTQSLLRGFGADAAMADIRIARTNSRIADWRRAERVVDIVTRTVLVYNDLYFARRNLEVAMRSKELASQLLEDNMKRAEIGVMSPLDVTSARAEVASREEGVILARREMENSENFLLQLVTRELEWKRKAEVRLQEIPLLQPLERDVSRAVAIALERRPDYREALLGLRNSRVRLAFARNEALPRLDLQASYGLNGLDTEFAESFRSAFEERNAEWTAGVVFSMPFPNRAGRGNALARQIELAQALVDLKRLEQDIFVGVDNASGEIRTAAQRMKATRQARLLAEERLAAEQEKLKAGTSTTFVVLELQKDLAEAEANELRAVTDYNKAIAEFDRETGMTFQRHGIRFAEGV